MPEQIKLVIEKHSSVTPEIAEYFKKIKLNADPMKRSLFDQYRTVTASTSGTLILAASIDNTVVGVLTIKREQLNHKIYFRIKTLEADDSTVAETLLDELISIYKTKQSEVNGIFTETFSADSNDMYTKALITCRFQTESNVYVGVINTLISKLPNLSNDFEAVRYKKSNKFKYRKAFIQLLTKHDQRINAARNHAFGKNVVPNKLTDSNSHRIAVTYFADNAVINPTWHIFLLVKPEEEDSRSRKSYQDDDEGDVVGFIKTRIVPAGITYPDVYIPEKHIGLFDGALKVLLKDINNTRSAFVGMNVSEGDRLMTEPIERIFHKPTGRRYFYF